MENKNTKIITGAIIGAAILVAAIIIAVVLPHVMLVNQQVLDLYNKANEAIIRDEDGYGGYYVETNQECRNYIGQAKETMAHSMFVKSSLKRQVNDLDDYIQRYDALSEIIELASNYDFKTADENLKYAGERKEIKDSEQYLGAKDFIEETYYEYVEDAVDRANYNRISKCLDDLMKETGITKKYNGSPVGIYGICGLTTVRSVDKCYLLVPREPVSEVTIHMETSSYNYSYLSENSQPKELHHCIVPDNLTGLEIAAIVNNTKVEYYRWFQDRLTAADIGMPEYYDDYVAQGYPQPREPSADKFTNYIDCTTMNSIIKPLSQIENPQSDDYLFPSDTRIITNDYLDMQTQETIALIRNEIYARHGYKFSDEKYQKYFSAKSWYHENSEFDESQFNAYEKQNKQIITSYESSKDWR